MIFYRNLVTAAFDINPDEMMKAVANEVINFEMPGANMANFRKNSIIIAKAGIYDPRLHFDEVVSPILRTWKVFERTDFGPEGEKAREELAAVPRRASTNRRRSSSTTGSGCAPASRPAARSPSRSERSRTGAETLRPPPTPS